MKCICVCVSSTCIWLRLFQKSTAGAFSNMTLNKCDSCTSKFACVMGLYWKVWSRVQNFDFHCRMLKHLVEQSCSQTAACEGNRADPLQPETRGFWLDQELFAHSSRVSLFKLFGLKLYFSCFDRVEAAEALNCSVASLSLLTYRRGNLLNGE